MHTENKHLALKLYSAVSVYSFKKSFHIRIYTPPKVFKAFYKNTASQGTDIYYLIQGSQTQMPTKHKQKETIYF